MVTATGGMSRAGSRLRVLIFLMPRMPRPEAKISTPPTRLISVISVSVMDGAIRPASRSMAPCQQNRMMAASAMPIPNAEESTMDVIPSRIALVNR